MDKKKPTASFLKDLTNVNGNASLYELSVPMEDYSGNSHKWVVVSTAYVMYSGIETYIFPSNENGEITNWIEMPYSQRGVDSHEEVLNDAGYDVKSLLLDYLKDKPVF